MPRWNENRLTAKLGIDYPIIQGPLGGLSSQRLTAAVSNFGGLGSFGAHGLTPGAIKNVIAQIRSLTSKSFAMNLWVSMEDEGARTSDENAFNRSLAPLAVHIAALGAPRPEYEPYPWIRFEDQVRVLLDERVPVFSFIYGVPPREILDECQAKGIVTIGTATTPDEAAALQDAGMDAIATSLPASKPGDIAVFIPLCCGRIRLPAPFRSHTSDCRRGHSAGGSPPVVSRLPAA